MRLFFALNFNDETRTKLLALRDILKSRSESGNFSAAENLHLTLAFLGACDAEQAAAAKTALSKIHFEPFEIIIDRIGRFQRRGGDIWWAGLRECKPFLKLQHDLILCLTNAGFIFGQSAYRPHITLGREVLTAAKPWEIEPFGETVSAVELMKSERLHGKLTYTAIMHSR